MVVTPFREDGALSAGELPAVVSFVLSGGCQGVSALGLGGEVATLSREERLRVAEVVVQSAAGLPAIIGCSAHDTEVCVSLALAAAELGAAAVMVAAPQPGLNEAELLDHFVCVARAVAPLPVMVQDAPDYVGVELGPPFVQLLRREAPNVTYGKTERVPAADSVAQLVEVEGIRVFGGHGALYFLDVLDAGAAGVIPGCEAPDHYARIWHAHSEGRHEEARALYAALLPLIVEQFQSLDYFVAASKLMLARQGILRSPAVRSSVRISALGERLLLDHARAGGITFAAA